MTSDNLRWLQHLPTGWHPLYRELVANLADIDPELVVEQAKQKLGWLRVYLQLSDERAEVLIRAAELQSRTLCELCGSAGELRINQTGWHRTLCDDHCKGFRPAKIGHHVTVPMSEMPQGIQLGSAVLPWPLLTLDFEASGLGEFTYPIEIGIARWAGPGEPIHSWSVLIKPPEAWRRHRIWMPESEKIHGITQDDLEAGVSPRWALEHANALLREQVVFCDGGEHDLRWLRHLAHAAQLRPTFKLADWSEVVGRLSPDQRARMVKWQVREPVHHRAGDDALRLLRSLASAFSEDGANWRDLAVPT